MPGTYRFPQRLAPRLAEQPAPPQDVRRIPLSTWISGVLCAAVLPSTRTRMRVAAQMAMATVSVAVKPSVTLPVIVASCSDAPSLNTLSDASVMPARLRTLDS